MRSPPWPSCGACQKCCCPVPKSVPTEAKLARWPPSSSSFLFARTTITIAFQRQIERMRSSSAMLPGECSSMCGGMVLTYAGFAELSQRGIRPGLAVVLAGDNPASRVYVRNKVRACEETGVRSELYELPAAVSEEALLDRVLALNDDADVHGILVQLPLPKHIK